MRLSLPREVASGQRMFCPPFTGRVRPLCDRFSALLTRAHDNDKQRVSDPSSKRFFEWEIRLCLGRKASVGEAGGNRLSFTGDGQTDDPSDARTRRRRRRLVKYLTSRDLRPSKAPLLLLVVAGPLALSSSPLVLLPLLTLDFLRVFRAALGVFACFAVSRTFVAYLFACFGWNWNFVFEICSV